MVPKHFQLAGLKIKVILDPELYKSKRILGECIYPKQQIIIDCSTMCLESVEQIFYHELIHWVFYIMGETEMKNNEKLVDMMALLLHHSFKSSGEHYMAAELCQKEIACQI